MMKTSSVSAIAAGLALASVQSAPAHGEEAAGGPSPIGVVDAQGNKIGTAQFEQTPAGVLISLDVGGLPPGDHALHVHEIGACDPAEGFKSAGGHFNPSGHQHGLKANGGPHAGDMSNQFAGADGALRAHVLNPNVRLHDGAGSLADADGSALVIHAGADDYATQPAGAAGGRIACVVIRPPSPM